MIRKGIFIEDLVINLPESISYLKEKNINCIACGEPIWDTLEQAARKKGYGGKDIEIFLKELNDMKVEESQK
jgi:iron-sulfur cluster repair protein YtfE (RIC family)